MGSYPNFIPNLNPDGMAPCARRSEFLWGCGGLVRCRLHGADCTPVKSYSTRNSTFRNSRLLMDCKLFIVNELWWAQQDSNLRLPPCEGGTLPLSYAPIVSLWRDSRQGDATHRVTLFDKDSTGRRARQPVSESFVQGSRSRRRFGKVQLAPDAPIAQSAAG